MAIKSGWLFKTPPNITKFLGWKKRHFDLFDNGDLAYSRSKEHDTVLGLIHLNEVAEISDAEETVNCLFTIGLYCPSQKRTLYLRAETRADIDSWCREIQRFVPAYDEHPPDKPVYRSLPDEVLDSLPTLAGFLYTPEMDLFTKAKFCSISEGQFRIYSNQSQEHLYLIFSLLCCKGVQELTDNTRGRSNSFQFKIDFTNKPKNSLVLSAKSPFERQGWIVCLMKTITVLSKHQNIDRPPLNDENDEPEPNLDVPLDVQVAELQEELNRRDAMISRLRDDKLALSNKMRRLHLENDQLKRERDRSSSDSSHLFTPEPGHRVTGGARPNTLPLAPSSGAKEGFSESYSSEGSGDCNFKDCSSSLRRPNSSNTASQLDQHSIVASIHDSVQAGLLTLCQELGCLDVDLETDLVQVLIEYIEQQRRDTLEATDEKDRDITTLETCKREQERTIGELMSELTVKSEEINELNTRYESQRIGMQEEYAKIEVMKSKLESELEALKEKIRVLSDQMEEKEKSLLEETDKIKVERDKLYENNIRIFSEHDRVRSDLNVKNSELDGLKTMLKEKEDEIQSLKSKQHPKKPPLPT